MAPGDWISKKKTKDSLESPPNASTTSVPSSSADGNEVVESLGRIRRSLSTWKARGIAIGDPKGNPIGNPS